MSSGENDILFRIGFESHPQAGAKMEALAKSVEALQVRMDQSMRRVGDRAIVEAGRVNAATGGGGGAGGGGGGGGGGASGAMGASSRKAQYDKEIEEDRHYRAAMARGGVAAHMTLKQQNEAVRIAGEARLTVQRQQADQAVILMEQLQRDIELVQRARGGNPDDASLDEVMAANERVQASHRVFEEGREREAAAEEKARKEQARAAEKANREAIKQQQARVKEYRRLAKEEEADEREALRSKQAVHREREAVARDQQRLAAEAARPWLDAYAQEVRAEEVARRQVVQGRRQLFGALSQTAEGLGKLSRSAVLLGLANGEQMEKVIRQLALVQAGIDLVRGGASIVRGVGQAFEAVRMILLGRIAAERAAQAAGRLSAVGSAAVTQALNLEAIAANRTALAHHMLARARAGGGAAGGAVRGAAGGAVGNAVGGGVGGAIGGAARGAGAAIAGSAIGAAIITGIKVAATAIGVAFAAVITAPVAIAAAVAVAAGGAAYYAMTKEDRDNASKSEETTKRIEHWSKLYQLEQGHLHKLARIREDAELQRASLTRSMSDAAFEDQMGLARTPDAKRSLMDGKIAELAAQRDAASARVAANTEVDANTGLPRMADGKQQLLEELIAAEERLLDAEKQRYSLTREIEGEKRKLRMDEIKGIEDIIRARMQERGELEKSYQTAKERFGALNEMEQKLAIKSLEKARAGGELSRKDIANLGNIGTDEAEGFVRDARIKSADAIGYDAANRGAIDAKQKAIDEANDASIATLASQPGQSEKEIRDNLAKPVKVDLVNYETLNVQLNQEENVLFDKVVAEIQRLRKQQADSLERRINESEMAGVDQERKEYQKAVQQAGTMP